MRIVKGMPVFERDDSLSLWPLCHSYPVVSRAKTKVRSHIERKKPDHLAVSWESKAAEFDRLSINTKSQTSKYKEV